MADTDTRLAELGHQLVLVIRRIAIATERRTEAERELTAAVEYRARLEEDIVRLSGGQLYGEPSAGRMPAEVGERTTAIRTGIRPERILQLSDPTRDPLEGHPWGPS